MAKKLLKNQRRSRWPVSWLSHKTIYLAYLCRLSRSQRRMQWARWWQITFSKNWRGFWHYYLLGWDILTSLQAFVGLLKSLYIFLPSVKLHQWMKLPISVSCLLLSCQRKVFLPSDCLKSSGLSGISLTGDSRKEKKGEFSQFSIFPHLFLSCQGRAASSLLCSSRDDSSWHVFFIMQKFSLFSLSEHDTQSCS